jgi:ketosteroid isomerase-like protein
MNSSIVAFKNFYQTFDIDQIEHISEIYAENVVFTDPLHTIHGAEALKDYFLSMCKNLTSCQFEFKNEIVGDGHASYQWIMHYQHPSIRKNKPLTLDGASFITFEDRIVSHVDFYDMGAMLYEHVPLLGGTIRAIKSRIGNGQ